VPAVPGVTEGKLRSSVLLHGCRASRSRRESSLGCDTPLAFEARCRKGAGLSRCLIRSRNVGTKARAPRYPPTAARGFLILGCTAAPPAVAKTTACRSDPHVRIHLRVALADCSTVKAVQSEYFNGDGSRTQHAADRTCVAACALFRTTDTPQIFADRMTARGLHAHCQQRTVRSMIRRQRRLIPRAHDAASTSSRTNARRSARHARERTRGSC
jgi:hypothetical protein